MEASKRARTKSVCKNLCILNKNCRSSYYLHTEVQGLFQTIAWSLGLMLTFCLGRDLLWRRLRVRTCISYHGDVKLETQG